MEEMVELLFELSSSDRLSLLLEVKAEKQRLTQLARKVTATLQETSRHLTRLSGAKLIEKDSAGFFELTSIGRLALDLVPSFGFLSKNKDYFLSHDISFLPPQFILRIGELAESEYEGSVTGILRGIEQMMGEAEQYIWLMGDQPLITGSFIVRTFGDRNISLRIIDVAGSIPLGSIDPERRKMQSELGARFELGLLDEVKVGMAMTEKVAGFCFPDSSGKIDFRYGFGGDSLSSIHRWCHDLFAFYWDKSKKRLPAL